tara:strand:- start:436 stop:576 length:141 start_codon:yes stop_codon:yes gene_type:complete
MLDSAIITLTVWLLLFFIGYMIVGIIAYFVLCTVEWCQEIKKGDKK